MNAFKICMACAYFIKHISIKYIEIHSLYFLYIKQLREKNSFNSNAFKRVQQF